MLERSPKPRRCSFTAQRAFPRCVVLPLSGISTAYVVHTTTKGGFSVLSLGTGCIGEKWPQAASLRDIVADENP
jgi:hypothetical protein